MSAQILEGNLVRSFSGSIKTFASVRILFFGWRRVGFRLGFFWEVFDFQMAVSGCSEWEMFF
jgi:hypothetical protein